MSSSSSVNVSVVSPDTRSTRRFDLHLTVSDLKSKLEMITGIPASSQQISLYNNEEEADALKNPVLVLGEDDRPLGYYSVREGSVLKVSDPTGKSLAGQFTDVSQVEKFEISKEEYASRNDTVLAYKQRNKMGRFADAPEEKEEAEDLTLPPGISVGHRCLVEGGRRAKILFVGKTEFGTGKGVWVGVQYDEPVGKNDGSVEGKRYFECPPKFGGFVRPEKLEVSDFPPIDLDAELEEM